MTSIEHLRPPQKAVAGFVSVLLVVALALACWAFVLNGSATGMSVWAMTRLNIPPVSSMEPIEYIWTRVYVVRMVGMWWGMMLAMMFLPIAIVFYRDRQSSGVRQTLAFLLRYSLVWLGFAVVAMGLQWILERAGLVHAFMMWSLSAELSCFLLVGAGVYQLSLAHEKHRNACKFATVSLQAGLTYGRSCVISSAPLMLLFFAGGTMNLVWMLGLTLFVCVERNLPNPGMFDRISGAGLIALGLWCGGGT
ncbi:DUF2182 domain-containing protein [uncultured Roseibium sp.]|uniref:DUF2182 domain-containing protein n=1 Tax=uncultured Roseibium sp. TaxID=1936171 RepID=UPI002595FDF9|nr:DUF2182 domain-containing protein [uncultured Roseibium sp.]